MSESGKKSKSSSNSKGKLADINSSKKVNVGVQDEQESSTNACEGGSVLADINGPADNKPTQK